MGKYMKKARGVRGGMAVMEVMTQEQLGVRTRARAQAMEKKEANSNSSNNKGSSSTSTKSYGPAQISYLELRSRRLEKIVDCNNNRTSALARKSTSADECRRLSDLTNSDMLADDCSSRLALSAEEAHNTRMATRHQVRDENRGFAYHFQHGDDEVEEDSLHCSVRRSLQQLRNGGNSRGRAPPGAAHSRSNSRSNSVTRELPLTCELPPRGILTRNQRKLEKQISDGIGGDMDGIVDMDVGMDAFCSSRHVHHAGVKSNSWGARNAEVEVSLGENPMDEGLFVSSRIVSESTPISHVREVETLVSARRLQPGLASHGAQAGLSNVRSPMDMEIEDFFLQTEQQEQRRFIERYNFDLVNDTPLAGRYEWVSLQPHL